jgi:hypothetical protein
VSRSKYHGCSAGIDNPQKNFSKKKFLEQTILEGESCLAASITDVLTEEKSTKKFAKKIEKKYLRT